MKASLKISPSIRAQLRETIQDTGGREVLAVGNLDAKGVVIALAVAARGDESSVPALGPYMEKGDVVIHNHPSGMLHPSEADLSVANRLGQNGVGFYIIDNLVDEIYAVAEPILLDELIPLDVDALTEVLGPQGPLARQIDYEPRDSQVDMLREVSRGFNDDAFIAAEAGTGVGKSFAYLIPAIAWAQANKERVVLSTATINLQQQLMDKDLPLVQRIMDGKEVKAVLVKGRGNYLCRRRLSEALEDDSLFRDEEDQLSKIAAWTGRPPREAAAIFPFSPRMRCGPRCVPRRTVASPCAAPTGRGAFLSGPGGKLPPLRSLWSTTISCFPISPFVFPGRDSRPPPYFPLSADCLRRSA